MLRNGRFNSVDELHDIDRTIIKLAKELKKPVCATCDVHFMDPTDAEYRKVLMSGGMGYDEARIFRTPSEMGLII